VTIAEQHREVARKSRPPNLSVDDSYRRKRTHPTVVDYPEHDLGLCGA
jgi:hypothetical protein